MAKATIKTTNQKASATRKTAVKKAPVSAPKTKDSSPVNAVSSEVQLPAYVKEVYGYIYEDQEVSRNLDDNRFGTLFTLGYNNKLAKAVCREVNYPSSVLQVGATFGNQIDKIASKIGQYGSYDIIDVSKTQIERCRNKFIYEYPKINFILQDATSPIEKKYDCVVCYMLLHEVPDPTKHKIVNNILSAINTNGKVIFVDYHAPSKWHPLRYIVKAVNRLYQPFAESLWNHEIKDFAENPNDYVWRKSLYFGKMYQRVVVTKIK